MKAEPPLNLRANFVQCAIPEHPDNSTSKNTQICSKLALNFHRIHFF
jgi:hypothetical protein